MAWSYIEKLYFRTRISSIYNEMFFQPLSQCQNQCVLIKIINYKLVDRKYLDTIKRIDPKYYVLIWFKKCYTEKTKPHDRNYFFGQCRRNWNLYSFSYHSLLYSKAGIIYVITWAFVSKYLKKNSTSWWGST